MDTFQFFCESKRNCKSYTFLFVETVRREIEIQRNLSLTALHLFSSPLAPVSLRLTLPCSYTRVLTYARFSTMRSYKWLLLLFVALSLAGTKALVTAFSVLSPATNSLRLVAC